MLHKKLFATKEFRAIAVFNDGSFIRLKTFENAPKKLITLELCFTTSITGFQETMTDPSYAGQALIFSFPHIGNTGINKDDIESCQIYTKAILLSEKPTKPSNFRSEISFEDWVIKNDGVCLFGADTRELIQKIRSGKIKNACFGVFEEGDEINLNEMSKSAENYTYDFETLIRPIISCSERAKEIEKIKEESFSRASFGPKTIVFDYGIKLNILRCLLDQNFLIKDVFPFDYDSEKIDFSQYDCIVFSNGPGDPAEAFQLNQALVEKAINSKLPILGICLGHQIIGIAHPSLKMQAFKMKQGHRGTNHPIKNLSTSKVEITSQNHGFALRPVNENSKQFINLVSLFDQSVAGFCLPEEKIITTQYHPESSAGTHDSRYIFSDFMKMNQNSH
jgi:carbamoyl-phosphate synthase small subunit